MANHISHAALPYPVKGARFTVPLLFTDADGDPTDPTTPDTEFSLDGAAFADCAEEVTTITGSNGAGFITLSGAETNGSLVVLCGKVASGPKAPLISLSPRVLPAIYAGIATAGAAGSITLSSAMATIADFIIGAIVKTTGGTGGGGTGGANNQARVITDYSTGRVATVVPDWEVAPASGTTYEILMTEACILRFANLKAIDDDTAAPVNQKKFFNGTGYGVHPAVWTVSSVLTSTTVGVTGPHASMVHDVVKGAMIVIRDDANPTNFFYAYILTYDGTLDIINYMPVATPGFTVAAGDIVELLLPGFTQTDRRLTQFLSGFAQAGSGTTIKFPTAASTANDAYNGYRVDTVDGPGAGQSGWVEDYDGPTQTATMNRPWVTTPTSSTYMVVRGPRIQFTGENVNTFLTDGDLIGVLDAAALEAISEQVETQLDTRLLSVDSTNRLERSTRAIGTGTAAGGGSTTSVPTSSLNPAASVTDQFKNAVILFDSVTATAALRGHRSEITASSAGGTLTVAPPLTAIAANGDTFTII